MSNLLLFLVLPFFAGLTFAQSPVTKGIAIIWTDQQVGFLTGHIDFTQIDSNVTLTGTIMIPGIGDGPRGIHIHESGNLTDGCTSARTHFNPTYMNHSDRTNPKRHVGDLGNIDFINSTSTFNFTVDMINLGYGSNSVFGRAIVIHSGKDDLGMGNDAESLITGNSGSRLACGVIAVG